MGAYQLLMRSFYLLWLFSDRGVGVDRTYRGVLERGPETVSTVAI